MTEEPKHISKELVITSHDQEVQVALLEDKKLVEIHTEKSTDNFSLGDIYLGTVRKIMPGLNAAFVNIGSDRDAFLHYLDLGEHVLSMNEFVNQAINSNRKSISNFELKPEIGKVGKISEILSSGQKILVQIAKEHISTKGARITTEISLAGRYLVLVPFMDKISVSQKIKNAEERKRLKKLVQAIKPKRFGIIIRTIAKDKSIEELTIDLEQLVQKWKNAVDHLPYAAAPSKIVSEMDMTSTLIRDMVNDDFESITVDSLEIYKEIKDYLSVYDAKKTDLVKLYKEKTPLFEHLNVAKQIKGSFGKVVTIKNGIYLIIEHTEAMHVIDVNSGNRVKSNSTQEENALNVNLEAAAEIARQLRLRDMGGIITIDFIDMQKASNRTLLYQTMSQLMKKDKAKHTILPVNKFGLIQITRQRVRQATIIENTEVCPACHGTGKIKPSVLLEEDIENMVEYLFEKQREKQFSIVVHPFVYAYLTKGIFSKRVKWFLKYKQWINIKANHDFGLVEYKFFNSDGGEIVFWTSPDIKG